VNTDRWPVNDIDEQDRAEEGIALCLSGGGYRAMLFHLGALWRLNSAGLLPKLQRISSVSGGSITAGKLGICWSRLGFGDSGMAAAFGDEVVRPIMEQADRTIDASSILGGVLFPGPIGDHLADHLRDSLFGKATLQDLPLEPRFVINATSLQSGDLVRFSRPYIWDYQVGKINEPTTAIAVAVAASAAFPPFLSPVRLTVAGKIAAGSVRPELDALRREMVLTDGGVYDNLGLETAFKRYRTLLVSDAGGRFALEADPADDWLRQSYRVSMVVDHQVRSLRKRQLIGAFRDSVRSGTYWGINGAVQSYDLADPLDFSVGQAAELAATPTRLAALPEVTKRGLVNWGYVIADTALRKWFDPGLPRPTALPF
jgi:NTE family protein